MGLKRKLAQKKPFAGNVFSFVSNDEVNFNCFKNKSILNAQKAFFVAGKGLLPHCIRKRPNGGFSRKPEAQTTSGIYFIHLLKLI